MDQCGILYRNAARGARRQNVCCPTIANLGSRFLHWLTTPTRAVAGHGQRSRLNLARAPTQKAPRQLLNLIGSCFAVRPSIGQTLALDAMSRQRGAFTIVNAKRNAVVVVAMQMLFSAVLNTPLWKPSWKVKICCHRRRDPASASGGPAREPSCVRSTALANSEIAFSVASGAS